MGSSLSDVRVAAFTHFAAGPLAAQYLGALGADVIKVESPQQDVNRYAVRHPDGLLQGVSPYFLVTNRNQRCIVIDLKMADGAKIAKGLIASADVVIENYRPGVMDRLGLGYADAKALKPDIIYCSLSAYDPTGPARDRPGQDLLLQASCGIASLTGHGNGPPVPVGAYVIDGFTAMQGVSGILSALHYRDRTGVGQWVRADMMSSSLYLMAQEASYVLNVDDNPKRSEAGIAHVNQSAPYGVYETRDGAIAISTFGGVPMVRKLAAALDLLAKMEPFLSERDLRLRRDDIAKMISDVLRCLSTAEAVARIEPTGAWVAPIRSLAEALADPATTASGVIKSVSTKYAGSYRVVIEPLKMSATPIRFELPAPAPGEHSRQVLEQLGYANNEIARLFQVKCVSEQG